MSSHFRLSAKARTLSLSAVLRMTDEEAEASFCRIRWGATDGSPVCPNCRCEIVYNCRKANGAPR
jgi:Transposase zinc-ribbon domain